MTRPTSDTPRYSQFVGGDKPRRNAVRHAFGKGRFVDDIAFGNLAHIAFFRSPYAHARIKNIKSDAARALAGVMDVFTGPDLVGLCAPWVGALDHFPGLRSPEQYPLAMDRAVWHGEPVVAIVAETRAIAEDAVDLIEIDWHELPAVVGIDASSAPDAPLVHPQYDSKLCFTMSLSGGRRQGGVSRRRSCYRGHVRAWASNRADLGTAQHCRRF